MIKVGIDKISFYTPPFFLDLKDLANHRNISYEKISKGLGQYKMSVPSCDEDVVTMALEACFEFSKEDLKDIDLVLFATETSVDQAKSAGIFVHSLLGLSPYTRVIELKQACYSGVMGLQFAKNYIQMHESKKVLLIASDIARYGLSHMAESSQGAGCVAIILSKDPKIVEIEEGEGYYTQDVMDFWRPNDRDTPIVDGRFSCEMYLKVLKKTWHHYKENSKREFRDHTYFCYHTPVPKLAVNANNLLFEMEGEKPSKNFMEGALKDIKNIGNCYSASLFVCLLSLLEDKGVKENRRIGMYSYGSGCSGEFFSLYIKKGFRSHLANVSITQRLQKRQQLSVYEYEDAYKGKKTGICKKKGYSVKVSDHKRIYKKCEA